MRQQPRVLVIDDQQDSLDWLQLFLEQHGYAVRVARDGAEAEASRDFWKPEIVLMDLMLPDIDGLELLRRFREAMPDTQVIMVTGHGSVAHAVDAMKAGALNFIEKPVDTNVLLAVLEKTAEHATLTTENRRLRQRVKEEQSMFGDMLTKSDKMRKVFDLIKSVAPTDASVLIRGENGTGKELVANAIHQNSLRSDGQLVKINCAAIPADLIESELFGYKRGAFTGAVSDKVGLFEQAHGGTLMLDEIGEMPAHLQAKLLRVLQERQARPLGGSRIVELDFRLICATNCDLEQQIKDGRFREDLYFRINTITMVVPSLRERVEDIPPLAEHFLAKFARQYNRPLTALRQDAYQALMRHNWRGNVRELEHAIERAVIVAHGRELTVEDLPESVRDTDEPTLADINSGPVYRTLAEIEKHAILRTLEHTRGNKRAAAAILGVYRPTLYSKLKKYGIGEIAGERSGFAVQSH